MRKSIFTLPLIALTGLIIFGLVVLVPIWILVITPKLFALSDNFNYSADIISIDNFYDTSKQNFVGETYSVTKFSFETEAVKNGTLLIKNIFDVRRSTGEQIFSVERNYAIDPVTKQHVAGLGDHDRTGFLFGPPEGNKKDFTYWHINYDTPAQMKFVGEEKILGQTVYKYKANYQADQTQNLTYLPEVGKTLGVNLDITLEMWIEPVTGWMVNYKDDTIAYYYNLQTGQRVIPWNHFSNTYSVDSVNQQLRNAQNEREKVLLVKYIFPAISIGIVIVLWIILFIRQSSLGGLRLSYFFLIMVPVAGFVTTGLMYWYLNNFLLLQLEKNFNLETKRIENAVLARVEIYKNVLDGTRGLFSASVDVSREEWKQYTKEINIANNYPGIQGIGFATAVRADEKAAFIEKLKSEGFPDFSIRPNGEQQFYAPVTYLEPFTGSNVTAFGFDMFSEPVRRTSMEKARDTGLPILSGKVKLVQEADEQQVQPGFLMYEAVYKNGSSSATLEDRQNNLAGFVYMPFRSFDFMHGIMKEPVKNISYQIFDGNVANDDAEIFTSDDGRFSKDPEYQPLFVKDVVIYVVGHPWTVRYMSLPGYELQGIERYAAYAIGIVGGVLTFFFTLIIYSIITSQQRAENLAMSMTHDLQQSTKENEAVFTSINEGLIVTDPVGVITKVNDEAIRLLGFSRTEMIGKKLIEVTQLQDAQQTTILETERPISLALNKKTTTAISIDQGYLYSKKDGTKFPVTLTVAPILVEESIIGAVEVFRDVSIEKEAGRKLVERKNELEKFNKSMIDRELKMIELKKELSKLKGE